MAKQPPKDRSEPTPFKYDALWYEAALESIGEGVITTDAQGIVTKINNAALAMLGYRQKEVLGKRFTNVIVAQYDNGQPIKILDRPIARAFLTGETVSTRAGYRRKDNQLIPVAITVSPVMVAGRPVGAIEVFRDLTAEIQNEKLKSDFISIASHQLRTPLSAINMYTRMIGNGSVGAVNEQQQEFIAVILGSIERMNELISTLLNITRIESGGLDIRPQTLDITAILHTMVEECLPAAAAKNITLTSQIDASLKELVSDDLLVREVLSNLLSNAVKYTPDGGSVAINITDRDRTILCRVTDTGYGIPSDAQQHIFSKFFRADNITKRDVSGTGLGLYLIKIIADKLGGELWFESEEEKGSTFYFSLPKDITG